MYEIFELIVYSFIIIIYKAKFEKMIDVSSGQILFYFYIYLENLFSVLSN